MNQQDIEQVVKAVLLKMKDSSQPAGTVHDMGVFASLDDAVAAATVAVCFWYPTRFVRSFRGSCREEALRAEIGVLFKKELYIPLSSLRTVESWVTPLHRAFRCRTIVLRFAGGAAILPLLPAAEAGELARLLEQLESVS